MGFLHGVYKALSKGFVRVPLRVLVLRILVGLGLRVSGLGFRIPVGFEYCWDPNT